MKQTAQDRPAARHVRKDDADAFIRHPDDGPTQSDDPLAESFGEEFLRSATTGQDTDDELFSGSEVSEEIGGPFLVSTGAEEYALDDNGLPEGGEAAGLPEAVGSLSQPPDSDVKGYRSSADDDDEDEDE